MRTNESLIHVKDCFALRYFSKENCRTTMLCLPFVGGNSTHFRALAENMPPSVKVLAVDPPGHGRAKGKLIRDVEELTNIYFENLTQYLKDDFYIFGHSLGGFIGYLLAKKLEKAGIFPKGVFISAAFPPDVVIEERDSYVELLNEGTIKELLIELGGNYELLAKNNSIFLLAYMPLIYSDYRLFLSFKGDRNDKLKSPAYIIYSQEDQVVEPDYNQRWKKFCQQSEFFKVNGSHNYMISNAKGVAEIVTNAMKIDIKK